MNKAPLEFLGWCGISLILLGYISVSFSILSPNNFWYQAMNGLGSLGIIAVAWSKKDYQPVALNVIWAIIAFVSIVRILLWNETPPELPGAVEIGENLALFVGEIVAVGDEQVGLFAV